MALMFELPFNYEKSPEQAKRYNFREIADVIQRNSFELSAKLSALLWESLQKVQRLGNSLGKMYLELKQCKNDWELNIKLVGNVL